MATKRKTTGSKEPHKRADDMGAAREALREAWRAWGQVAMTGNAEGMVVAEILDALNLAVSPPPNIEHGWTALRAKNGPQSWARAYLRGGNPSKTNQALFATKAGETARRLVEKVSEHLAMRSGANLATEEGAMLLVNGGDMVDGVRVTGIGHVVMMQNHASMGAARLPEIAPDKQDAALAGMRAEVRKVASRLSADAKAYAVALLIGLGMTRDGARNWLKDKDV